MRWKCQCQGCFLEKRSDVAALDGCFPAHVGATDLDGIVELGGHFLVIEFKHLGVLVPRGQGLMFERMVATGKFTVVIVHARGQDVESWTVLGPDGRRQVKGDLPALRAEVKAWSRQHDPRPVDEDVMLPVLSSQPGLTLKPMPASYDQPGN